jgi:hypothetical protein
MRCFTRDQSRSRPQNSNVITLRRVYGAWLRDKACLLMSEVTSLTEVATSQRAIEAQGFASWLRRMSGGWFNDQCVR